MKETHYFQVVENVVESKAAASLVYRSPDKETSQRFTDINGLTSSKQTLYPGHFLVVPSTEGMSEQARGGISKLPEAANHAIRHGPVPLDKSSVNDSFHLLDPLSASDLAKWTSKAAKAGSKYYGYQLKEIQSTLTDYHKLYLAQAREGSLRNTRNIFNVQNFSSIRRSMETRLQSQLVGLQKPILGTGAGSSIRDSLGISHKSLTHQIKISGAPEEIEEIAETVGRVNKMAKWAERAGRFGKYLGMVPGTIKTYGSFRDEGATSGFRTMAKKAAGVAYGIQGGVAGAAAGELAATAAVIAFGVGTGGLGLVAIGAGIVVGAAIGGYAGSEIGKYAIGGIMDAGTLATSKVVDWFGSR